MYAFISDRKLTKYNIVAQFHGIRLPGGREQNYLW